MHLKLVRHLWGVTNPVHSLPRFQSQGYEGIEVALGVFSAPQEIVNTVRALDLDLIPQIFSAGFVFERDVDVHVESFARQLEEVARHDPAMVVCHSGCDAWCTAEAEEFYSRILEISRAFPFRVAHETHRGRYFFNPWNCAAIIDHFPDLWLCCDFSHWVCVCERLIDDQIEIIRRAAEHCIHLHARVGYEQGPQVPDPSAPHWARHLAAYEKWWDIVWQTQRDRGDHFTTLTPEFGPPPYMPTTPHDNTPLVDLAEVCDWMAMRQRDRFAAFNN